ncbi:MAG: tetratricopeptide repeat protein [Planctomycetota bacterium]
MKKTNRDRKTLLLSLWIFLIALGVRLLYLFQASSHPAFDHPLVDSGKYYELARALAEGRPMNLDFFWQVFFYPLFLTGVFKAFGTSLVAAKAAQMVLGSVTCVLVFHSATKVYNNRPVAIAAALITALYGPLIYFEGEILATGLAAFWAILLLFLYLKASASSKGLSYFALGLVSGLSVITRVTFLPFVSVAGAAAVFFAFRRNPQKKQAASLALALAAGFLAVALPVAFKCEKVSGRFSILPETGALNLYMGNNSADENFMAVRPGAEWDRLLNQPVRNGATTRAEARRYFMDRFWNYLFQEPARFAKGIAIKTGHFFSSREVPSNADLYSMREHSSLLATLMWKVKGFGFPFGLLLPLTLLGMALSIRRLPLVFYLFFLLYPTAIVVVFVTARYRAPMVPVMALPAAAGLMAIVDAIRERRIKAFSAFMAVVVLIAVMSSLAGPFPAEKVDYEAESCFCLGVEKENSKDPAGAQALLEEALRLNPEWASAHEHLGYILLNQGRTEPALQHLKDAVRIDPEIESATFALGKTLLQQQERQEALPYLEKAARINPRNAEYASTLGTAYGSLNRPEEALSQFKRALAMKPGSPDELYNMAISLYQMGDLDGALEELGVALKTVQRSGNKAFEGKIQALGARIAQEKRARQGEGR